LAVSKLSGLMLCMFVTGCANTGRLDPTNASNGLPSVSGAGICWVGVWIEKSGAVSEAALIKSTGVRSTDAACLNAVRGQEFETGLIIDPVLFNPGTLRRYTVVELHWRRDASAH
jgi:hypothetical protein